MYTHWSMYPLLNNAATEAAVVSSYEALLNSIYRHTVPRSEGLGLLPLSWNYFAQASKIVGDAPLSWSPNALLWSPYYATFIRWRGSSMGTI